ncbi:Retrotransposon-derived protein PEG10 [Rhizoctonia solani]|uniref:Retrotransposon-derived protein PEG10 n=1 Tax=Rhizoctonia solani TaxID=456999 RepID=A0A8H8SU89_9AGAM|nr:Retrotransposon-derived protein PEG10 [Rhizoctonia solani]QRW17984.1 Retrotransposon-derived protein PEG10 [Rhizoctonia solani]
MADARPGKSSMASLVSRQASPLITPATLEGPSNAPTKSRKGPTLSRNPLAARGCYKTQSPAQTSHRQQCQQQISTPSAPKITGDVTQAVESLIQCLITAPGSTDPHTPPRRVFTVIDNTLKAPSSSGSSCSKDFLVPIKDEPDPKGNKGSSWSHHVTTRKEMTAVSY